MKNKNLIIIIAVIFIVIAGISMYCINTRSIESTDDNVMNEYNMQKIEIAEIVLEEKFNLGMELIAINPKYFEIEKEPSEIKTSDEGLTFGYYKIINYEEICNMYLTDNAKKYLDENGICLVWIDNEPYLAEGGGGKSLFGKIEFENITIEEDTIEADAIMTMIDSDVVPHEYIGKAKSKFRLKKVNDIWKIDEFVGISVDDLDEWEEI